MNVEIEEKKGLEAIFPSGKTVIIPRENGQNVELKVMPMPVRKWKQGIKYIAQIAPLLGFNFFGSTPPAENTENKPLDDEISLDLPENLLPPTDLKDKILQVVMGEGSDLLLEFLAFAIDKEVTYFDDMYDEIIDITIAVIEVNLNFFVQKLLPKIVTGTKQVTAIAQNVRKTVQK